MITVSAPGAESLWWLLTDMISSQILLALLVVALVLFLVSVAIGWLLLRMLGRLWGRAALSLRAGYASSAPQRELARLRLRLDKAVGSARTASAILQSTGRRSGELSRLMRRLEHSASELDSQLCLMQGEPDDEALREFLIPARDRVEELVHAVAGMRRAATTVLSGEVDGALSGLAADVDREVMALQAGVDALQFMTPREMGPLPRRREIPGPRPRGRDEELR